MKEGKLISQIGESFSFRKNVSSLFFSSSPSRIGYIDGIRAVACLWLVSFHAFWFLGFYLKRQNFVELAYNPIYSFLVNGSLGVDLFFIISGFLIGNLLLEEYQKTANIKVGKFYLARLFRLMPALIVALTIYYFVIGYNNAYLWANLLYVNNFISSNHQAFAWGWSLAIEEQFYLIVPLFLLLFLKKYNHKLLIFSVIIVVLGFFVNYFIHLRQPFHLPRIPHPSINGPNFYKYFDNVYIKPYVRYTPILLGFIVAYLVENVPVKTFFSKPFLPKLFLYVALLIMLAIVLDPNKDLYTTDSYFGTFITCNFRNIFSVAVSFLLLSFIFLKSKIVGSLKRFLEIKFFYHISQVSYSMFLFNPIFILKFYHLAQIQDKSPFFIGCVAVLSIVVTYMSSMIVYIFIEKPFQNLRKVFLTN